MSTTVAPKNFWEGTGFWVAAALGVLSIWAGFTTETGDLVADTITQIFGASFALRQVFKESQIDLRKWIGDANTWAYLTAFFSPIFGPWVADVVPLLQEFVNSLVGGANLSQIITSAVTLAISIFYLFRDRAGQQIANALKSGTNE